MRKVIYRRQANFGVTIIDTKGAWNLILTGDSMYKLSFFVPKQGYLLFLLQIQVLIQDLWMHK